MSDLFEDQELIEGLLRDKGWAVQIVYDRITPIVKSRIYSFQEWEDARQQCMLRIIKAVRRIPEIESIWGLIGTITVRTVISYNRYIRRMRDREGDSLQDESENGVTLESTMRDPRPPHDESYDMIDLILYVFQRLGEECRKVLKLVFIEGFSYAGTAARLNITEGNLRVKIHRCTKKAAEIRDSVV